jgi:hypothetical protein
MKRFFLFICIFFLTVTNAQTTEFRISLDSGLYSYGGDGSSSNSEIQIYEGRTYGYTKNPYGSNVAFCFGLSFDVRQVNKNKFVYGANLGYEILRSKTDIWLIDLTADNSSVGYVLNGIQTTTTNYNITLFPYIGQRFKIKKSTLDLTLGGDVSYILGSQEKGSATVSSGFPSGTVIGQVGSGSVGNITTIPVVGAGDGNKTTYTSSNNIYTTSFDFRPRLQVSVGIHNFGLYLGYAYGLVNYNTKPKAGVNTGNTYSRMIRFGVSYKLL